ncbi:MAG: hypothetical protein WA738_20445 [Candidatus Angelobacter sp.]
MENAFVIALRVWVGLWGIVGLVVAFGSEGEFRWGRGGRGPIMRPQWLGRLFFAMIVLFLFGIAIFLHKAS